MKALILASLISAAIPLTAQAAAQTSTPPTADKETTERKPRPAPRQHFFAGISKEGRQVLMQAMRNNASLQKETHEARNRINQILVADTLDTAALKKAMDDERNASMKQHAARQDALLEAFQKLSKEDRKAFADNANRERLHMQKRVDNWRRDPASKPNRGQPVVTTDDK